MLQYLIQAGGLRPFFPCKMNPCLLAGRSPGLHCCLGFVRVLPSIDRGTLWLRLCGTLGFLCCGSRCRSVRVGLLVPGSQPNEEGLIQVGVVARPGDVEVLELIFDLSIFENGTNICLRQGDVLVCGLSSRGPSVNTIVVN